QSASPPQNTLPAPVTGTPPNRRMATRPQALDSRYWRQISATGLAIAGNALGLLLFLVGLGMVLRLMEVLLH
ncbi:MAG: hypothetical protein ACREO9_12245, partial [Lysobacterales bacterium]